MKIRGSIWGLVVIAAVLITLVLWHGRKQPVETPPTVAVQTNVAPPVATMPSVPVRTNAPAAKMIAPTPMPKPVEEGKNQRMREILAAANDVPIVFYGKLEDQFGNPVAGAEVKGTTIINNGTSVGANRVTVVSDGNGFFQLDAGKGQSLGIMPRKAGYALATTGTEFRYSQLDTGYYVPDPNNPTVIKMWKLQGAEPLVSINQHYKLHYTDTPINFDLLAGQIVPSGGDLKITVNRSAGEVSEHNPQDWSVQVEAVDGGLIETTVAESRATYAAPEDGYQPSAAFEMSTATQSWHAAVDQMFFLESRNGKVFSKVRLILGINEKPDGFMDITFSGVANANSSRNWEATVPQ